MLHRPLVSLAMGGWLLVNALPAGAFSLLGPFDEWQQPGLYYNTTDPVGIYGLDIGGPQNLGEEYRWNVPTIFYSYDYAFLDYFGQKGVEAIEKAIAIFNALPQVSQLSADLSEYPLDVQKVNHRASALFMLDLKSVAMGLILEEMGLTHAERFAWTLRNKVAINPPGCPVYEYRVAKRNFDPITWMPTSYVNGVLYTYLIIVTCDPEYADAQEIPVDPTAITHRSVSASLFGLQLGGYLTGLTRDDVGGLRYLYRANNYNVEDLPPGSQVGLGGGGIISGGGDGGWIPIPQPSTNQVPTDPTDPTDPGTGIPAAPTIGLRPGVEKIQFVRVDYDSVLGSTFRAFTNQYSSIIITNGRAISQNVRRPVTFPDLVFSAGDLLDSVAARTAPNYAQAPPPDGGTDLNGPGVIPPGVAITFNKVGPLFAQAGPPFLGEDTAAQSFIWGSFDGTTNPPVVFPNSTSINELEAQVLGGR